MSGPLAHADSPPHERMRRMLAGIAGLSLVAATAALVAPVLGHVPGPEIQVVKSSSASSVTAGGAFDYRLIAFNKGNEAASNVIVTDDLADAFIVKTATWTVNPPVGPTGTCTVGAGNTISCAIATLAAADGDSTPPEEDTVFVKIH